MNNWLKGNKKKEVPVNIYRITLSSRIEFTPIFDTTEHVTVELTHVWEISEATSHLYSYFGQSFTQEQAEENLIKYSMWPINVGDKAVTIKEPNNRYYIERSAIYSWKFWEKKKVELIGNHIELGVDRQHDKLVSVVSE
jgi:hypothetical protein